MKKIINGKRYNTETANYVASYDNGLSCSDFRNYSEILYRTKKGTFFLSGEGGPMSHYSRPCGDMTSGGSDLVVLDHDEAREWLERHDFVKELEEYFADEIEEG